MGLVARMQGRFADDRGGLSSSRICSGAVVNALIIIMKAVAITIIASSHSR